MDQISTEKPKPLQTFLEKVESIESIEEKLPACIEFMQVALSQNASPDFKGFWHVRKLCFPYFKESLPGQLRADMWNLYVELTKEGRRLKNILDQESSFAASQIDLAIEALEKEVEDPQPISLKMPKQPKALEGRYDFYEVRQKELGKLNVFASRINSLRKELIKIDMRVRHKNKFFTRLSALGDLIFPRRKELIKDLSESFLDDVNVFTDAHFSEANFNEERICRLVFFYREEIKGLQALAKVLTINTHAFTQTRQSLSECWDMLRGMEKELKKEHAHHKQKSNENKAEVIVKIEEIKSRFENKEIAFAEGLQQLKEVNQWMREVELVKADVHELREALTVARAPMEAIQEAEIQEARDKEMALEKERKQRVERFVELLDEGVAEKTLEDAKKYFENLQSELSNLSMTKAEKQMIDRKIRILKDQIADKEEEAILALPDDAREQLSSLQKMFDERQLRRKEIKGQIEEYRKVLGGSNLDFEKAMKYNELMASEKEVLTKCDASVVEIEKKIREIKNRS